MKTLNFKDIQKMCLERRQLATLAVRKVDKGFYLGKREFDRPRKNPEKQRILDSLKNN